MGVNHEEPEVMMMMFWASWCKFSQVPVKAVHDMFASNKSKWGNKVRLVGLSIDQNMAQAKTYIEEKGITEFEHYNVNPKVTKNMCKAMPFFGVKKIPYVVLVDKQGKIAFLGHPNWRKLDEDINTLLKGKSLTGRGVESFSE